MVDTKKEQEREELHRAIWAIADELRGAVDGWDFKNYVLGTMFYRYISENITAYINSGEVEAGNIDFDYVKMADEEAEEAREGLVQEKGFFILPSELFCNVRARASLDENLNETLEQVFRHIEESAQGSQSENSFAGLFDDFDVNSNKLGSTVAKRNERLVKLLDGVAAMNLGSVKDHDIDAFGDAYEYLMTMYASNAGKSGGEFFTPADVSVLLTKLGTVGKTTINKVCILIFKDEKEHQRFRIYVRENWYRKDAFANDIWIPHMEQLPGYNMDAFREEYLNMQILRKMLEEFRKNDNTKN